MEDVAYRAPTLLLATLFVYWLSLAAYRVLFHPLVQYPGLFAANLTGLYMMAFTIMNKNTYVRHDLHKKYDKIVRTGPNELCFSDEPSVKDIYGQSAEPCLNASVFYEGFTMTGKHSVFSTTDRNVHQRMRRLLSFRLSQQGVLNSESEISELVGRYVRKIEEAPQPVDLHDLTHHLFLDVTSQLAFAKSFDTLSSKPQHRADDIYIYFNVCPMFGQIPIARYFPFGPCRAAREAQPRIIRSVQSWIDEFKGRLREGNAEDGLL